MAETTTYVLRLKTKYRDEIKPKLLVGFKRQNVRRVGGLEKIVVDMGVGAAAHDHELTEGAVRNLATITGQKPVIDKARGSIVQFELREGNPIEAHVTLRGNRIWEFLDHLLAIILPQIRNFRSLSAEQFDGYGDYTFGLAGQSVFRRIDQGTVNHIHGMDITVVTTATTDDEGRALLKYLGFSFKED